jgi:hypothetical protein
MGPEVFLPETTKARRLAFGLVNDKTIMDGWKRPVKRKVRKAVKLLEISWASHAP